MRSVYSVLTALVLVFATAAPVMAQDESAKYDAGARSRFRIGARLYEEGKYEAAAKEFAEAHRLSGRPELLYNIYLAHRDAGQQEKALEALQAYLASDAEIENRAELETALHELERKIEKSAAIPPEDTGDKAQEIPVAGTPEKQLQTDEEPGSGFPVLPVVLISGGGALVLGGVITGALALSANSDLDRMCPSRVCPPDLPRTKAQDASSKISTLSTVTDVLLIGGVIVAGVGVTLLVLEKPRSESPAVTAGCGPTGCAGRIRFEF